MRRLRRTKVVATLGPASGNAPMIARLFEAGADVFRINMSHSSHDRMRELVAAIRHVEKEHNRPIGILVDLQGPKLRIGAFAGSSVMLDNGATFTFDAKAEPGDATRVHLPHTEIFEGVRAGHTLLLDDGKIRLVATEANKQKITVRVEVGGKLSDRKGVSLPDSIIPFSALTPKDRSDLDAALDAGIDWIGLSFVQRPDDIAEAKKITRGRAAVMAKIQKPLTRAARKAGKPVVVATQMLESMISSPVPTRAEVSDAATAIFDGADAVMLSAESAAGQFPVEAVATMNRIAEEVEGEDTYHTIMKAQHAEPEATGADAIAAAARQIAETLDLSAIICWTFSGSTGLRVARERPQLPIVAISPNLATGRKLSVAWGIHSIVAEDAKDTADMVERACRLAFKDGFAKSGRRVIIVA